MINKGIDHAYSYNSINELTEENTYSIGINTTKITVTGKVSDPAGVKALTVNGIKATISAGTFSLSGVILTKGANVITVKATDTLGNTTTKLIHVTYDPTKKTIYTYDNNGNLTVKNTLGNTANLTYDERNMLTGYSLGSLTESYQYDGDGKRISVSSNSSTINYIYDGLNVISERNSSGATTSSYSRNPNLPGGIGSIISRQSATATPQYYQYDGLGSVVNLTNPTGLTTQSYNYDAFGNVTAKSGLVTNSRQFLTKETDASGLVYFGARYYDPSIGRFITQDTEDSP